jgi:hypothetical protein
MVERSTIAFPAAPGGEFSVTATPLLTAFIAIGTGYGMEIRLAPRDASGPARRQGFTKSVEEIASFRTSTASWIVARFDSSTGASATGSTSTASWGAFAEYGMHDAYSGA